MLLLMDVGNTSTTYGYYRNGRLTGVHHVLTSHFPSILSKLINKKAAFPFNHAVLSCVFPKIGLKIKNLFKRRLSGKLWVTGENLRIQIRHNYRRIKKLGSDRVVNIYGGLKLYRPPLLILDYGTALTCDFISGKGVFEGGLIIPGPEISLKALSANAALLPSIPFPRKKPALLGRDTRSCMEAGILQGVAAMTDGLTEYFRRRYGRLTVVATGGLASVIYPLTRQIDVLDPLLTLRSLALAFLEYGPTIPTILPLDRKRSRP